MKYSHDVCFLNHALQLRNEYAMWSASALLRHRLTPRKRKFLTATCLVSNNAEELTPIIDYAYERLTFGSPDIPFAAPQEEAKWWTERATLDERKAFLVACFGSLEPKLQHDFVDFVHRERAQ